MGKKKEEAPPVAPTTPVTPPAGGGGINFQHAGPYDEAAGGFSNFAKTGGFSQTDLSNIRSRALSPVRAVYSNANREVNRQKAVQGGYSPNYTAAMTRMAREQGQATSDAATNAEAGISEQVQKGKLAGLQGLSGMVQYGQGGGGGGGDDPKAVPVPEPEQKKGFWGKLGSGLAKVGKVALPIALNYFSGGASGAIAGAMGSSGKLAKIAKAAGGNG